MDHILPKLCEHIDFYLKLLVIIAYSAWPELLRFSEVYLQSPFDVLKIFCSHMFATNPGYVQ